MGKSRAVPDGPDPDGPDRAGAGPGGPVRRGSVRRLLPGSNTAQGFYSYFPYLWRPLAHPDPRRVWIIKGGPGTGKSVFMNRVADDLLGHGYDVEFHHCAADPGSIDGLAVPALGVAVVDGTSPHNIDPAHPGVVEEIIYLGDHWEGEGLRRQREAVLPVGPRYKGLYAAAYRYLAAAATIHDEWREANAGAQDWGKVNAIAWDLLADLLRGRKAGAPGYVRKLFGCSITPDGPRHFLEELVAPAERLIILTGPPGTGKAAVVRKLATALAEHGFNLELFHCGLHPEEPEHFTVPELGLAVVSSEEPHVVDGTVAGGGRGGQGAVGGVPRVETIDLGRLQDPQELGRRRARIERARAAFWDLMEKAMVMLREARDIHNQLEGVYGAHMDFDAVEQRRRRLVEEILALAPAGG